MGKGAKGIGIAIAAFAFLAAGTILFPMTAKAETTDAGGGSCEG